MILKRYGVQLHSVEPNFDARAMNEIGFRRSHQQSYLADEFAQLFHQKEVREFTAEAKGFVQTEAEQATLEILRQHIDALDNGINHGHVLVVENEQGRDYPKLREHIVNLVIESENRLEFHRRVDPPLRIGIYAPRST